VQPAGTRAGFEAGLATAGALVIDLQAEGDDPLTLVQHARVARPDLPILGFFPHVESTLRKQAVAAGVDPVLPRSKFAAELPELLRALATGNP
jgi:DNA-binding NarL/FixJ family response regulator